MYAHAELNAYIVPSYKCYRWIGIQGNQHNQQNIWMCLLFKWVIPDHSEQSILLSWLYSHPLHVISKVNSPKHVRRYDAEKSRMSPESVALKPYTRPCLCWRHLTLNPEPILKTIELQYDQSIKTRHYIGHRKAFCG